MTGMDQKSGWWHSWEITIDSDWITAVLMAVFLLACGTLLISEITHFAWGSVVERSLVSRDLFRNVINAMTSLCFFMAVFTALPKLFKISSLLMGVDFAGRLVLGYFHVSNHLQHFTAIAGSALRQIALTLALVAILQWFKTVTRWVPRTDSGTED